MPFSWANWVLKPIAVVSTIALTTLGLASTKSSKARFYFKSTLYLAGLGAASLWGIIVTVIATALGDRKSIQFYAARSFYYITSPLVGIDFDVEGEEHITDVITGGKQPTSAVVVGNHQSSLDLLYMGRTFGKDMVVLAKQELKWSPILGQFMWLSGAVFIKRRNRKDAVQTMQQVGRDMKRKGVSVWIFPEGTRSNTRKVDMLPFKKGAFHLAIQAQVPIIPVVCEDQFLLYANGTRFDSGRLKVKVLPPISTVGMTADDVQTLADTTRDVMLRALLEISPRAQGQSPVLPPADDSKIAPIPDATKLASNCDNGDSGVRQRVVPAAPVASYESLRSSHEGTTEDEMDDDAVLLRRPKGELVTKEL